MEEIKKLIDVLERKGKSSSAALLNIHDDHNLESRLYHAVKEDKTLDEEILLDRLYNNKDKEDAYKMLKSRVKRKLYNQLFFLDIDKNQIIGKVTSLELKCRKLLYFAEVLRSLGEIELAEQQFKKVLTITESAELTKYAIDALEKYLILVAERKFKVQYFEEVTFKLHKLYEIYEYERKTKLLYYDVRFHVKLGVQSNYKLLESFTKVLNEMDQYWRASGSSIVFMLLYRVKMLYYEYVGDAEGHIDYLNKSHLLFKKGKINKLYFSENLNNFLLVFAYLRAKKYKQGFKEAEVLKGILQEGTSNWFANLENYFMLAVHSRNYKKAEEILTEVLTNKYLKDLTSFAQERWLLFYKYMGYISGFSMAGFSSRKMKFVSQDKKGYNVWSLILDFIVALQQDKPELLTREKDRVRKFMSKYLKSKEDARTKIFLKLLLIIGKELDDAKVCRKKCAYMFKKLKQTPAPGIAFAETEIVPYESLLEIILQRLELPK